MACRFLGGARGVERDEAGNDFGRGQISGPAVGGGNGGVDLFVKPRDDASTGRLGAVIKRFTLRRGGVGAPAQPGNQIINLGHGQPRHFGECGLARGVKLFGEFSNYRALFRSGLGEGKWVESFPLGVSWIIAYTKPTTYVFCPVRVETRR